jgi:hypothetical protein
MFSRLINTIASTFYKTKWTHHLPPKHPNRTLQTPIPHWRIFKGDVVQMRVGDDKGKIGKVVKVFRKKNRVIVNGLNKNFRFKSKAYIIQQIHKEKCSSQKRHRQSMSPTLGSMTPL